MADNLNVTPGIGATVAADDVVGKLYQRIKIDLGGAGVASPLVRGQQTKANSIPFTLASDEDILAALSYPSLTAGFAAAAANVNATIVKASAGRLFTLSGTNIATTRRYLKVYNIATTPANTDTPVLRYSIPAGAPFAVDFPRGLAFATGISFRWTTAVADNDIGALTAGDIEAFSVVYA